jgi:hypothetical protein
MKTLSVGDMIVGASKADKNKNGVVENAIGDGKDRRYYIRWSNGTLSEALTNQTINFPTAQVAIGPQIAANRGNEEIDNPGDARDDLRGPDGDDDSISSHSGGFLDNGEDDLIEE